MSEISRSLSFQKFFAFIYFGFLMIVWILAWQFSFFLESRLRFFEGDVITWYWIGMKILLWVLPIFIILKIQKKSWRDLGFQNIGKGIKTGLLFAFFLIITTRQIAFIKQTIFQPPVFDPVFINAVFIAPLVEEIVFRGFLMKEMEKFVSKPFLINVLSSLLFVMIHIPGWFFQENLSVFIIIRIFIFGIIFAYAKQKSDSLYASIIVHILNNFFSFGL